MIFFQQFTSIMSTYLSCPAFIFFLLTQLADHHVVCFCLRHHKHQYIIIVHRNVVKCNHSYACILIRRVIFCTNVTKTLSYKNVFALACCCNPDKFINQRYFIVAHTQTQFYVIFISMTALINWSSLSSLAERSTSGYNQKDTN